MTTTHAAVGTSTTQDAIQRVHHHTWERHVAAGLRGEPIPMLCGLVKRGGPTGWDLPCCPMCADVMASLGGACGVNA